ncbi:unnamed protein product, partial [Polarella glacialis]
NNINNNDDDNSNNNNDNNSNNNNDDNNNDNYNNNKNNSNIHHHPPSFTSKRSVPLRFIFLTAIVNKNNSKISNKQQKDKTDRGEMLLEPTSYSIDHFGQ